MRRIALALTSVALILGVTAAPAAARQPGPTIVGAAIAVNAQTGEFSHLIEAVTRAGLVDTLNGHRQLTVFAPTDAAFEDLFTALGVSGYHARVFRTADGYAIEDMKSRNGIWINGGRIFHATLRTGDQIRMGATDLKYEVLFEPSPKT